LESIYSQQNTKGLNTNSKGLNFLTAEPHTGSVKDAPLQNVFHQQAVPTVTLAFYYTGGMQYWTAPVGVTSIQVANDTFFSKIIG
jgi:hypothetical protein